MTFQEIIQTLQEYWAKQGCLVVQPYDLEKGASTFNPATFLRVLGPEPWNSANIEPCRRPKDGRYGENPNRTQHYYQFQVIMKPSPADIQELYRESLRTLGLDLNAHDVRFTEDDWESPTLGAAGLGWQVWLDGLEITQFTYFQQMGSIELYPVPVEITYGLERIAMFLQNVGSMFEIEWAHGVTYGELFRANEIQWSRFNFEASNPEALFGAFNTCEQETQRLIQLNLVMPAYDQLAKSSHLFNLLDARGAISVTERVGYITRLRNLAKIVAQGFILHREELGFPMKKEAAAQAVVQHQPVHAIGDQTKPADALFEIGCEELPPGYFNSENYEALKMNLDQFFKANGYQPKREDISVEATPRRIVFVVKNLAPLQPSTKKEIQGPKKELGYKSDGTLTPAGEGFLRKTGAKLEDIIIQDGKLVVIKNEIGKPTLEILAGVFKELFKKIQFLKTMRWEESQTRFARPIRWLVALYGNEVINLEIAGVKAGRKTYLHPLNPAKTADVKNLDDYLQALEKGKVVLNREVRQNRIVDLLVKTADNIGGIWQRNTEANDLLLKVTMMVEYPGVLVGNIKDEYMSIPPDVLITAMREHQQYFAVTSREGGMLPKFLAIHDNPFAENGDAMRPGCERVLEARLKDAQFFHQEDMKHPLLELVPQLERVMWVKGLGNLLDKTKRLEVLCGWLADRVAPAQKSIAQQAAQLAKTDLISNMVQEKEYTSLQGIMGGIYAKAQGFPDAVAEAVGEQYLPRWANDVLPQTPAGSVLALADKLDHLLGCWGAGFAPTGAKDPYALRRAAQGIIAITLKAGYRYALPDALRAGLALYPGFQAKADSLVQEICLFIQGRMETELANQGIAPDISQAVLGVWWDDLAAVMQKAKAIHALRSREGFNASIVTFSRVVNILPKDTIRQCRPQEPDLPVEQQLLTEPAEKQLYVMYQKIGKNISELSLQGAFEKSFETLGQMKSQVDQFFDQVMVMDKNDGIRRNRLNLLNNLARAIWSLADFSKLVVAAE